MKFLTTMAVALGALLAASAHANASSVKQSSDDAAATEHASATDTEDSGHAPAPAGKKGDAHWEYSGKSGPENWGRVSKDFRACRDGRMQSPIDISGGFGATGDPIQVDYRLTPLEIVHNGHTVQVNYEPGSSMTVGGKTYELLQFHFHTPSEHAVAHGRTAMEVHFVHMDSHGALAVIGILLRAGETNRALGEIWPSMPRKATPAKTVARVMVNARDLLPRDMSYYRYMGSLTTPPCSESVNWFVLTEPIQVSMAQIAKFAKAVGENARPLQALNSRLVLAPNGGASPSH